MKALFKTLTAAAFLAFGAEVARSDMLYLKDGTVLYGELSLETDTEIEFIVKNGAVSVPMKLSRSKVDRIERLSSKPAPTPGETERSSGAGEKTPPPSPADEPVPDGPTRLSKELTAILPSLFDPFRVNFTARRREPNRRLLEVAAASQDVEASKAAGAMLEILDKQRRIAKVGDVRPEAEAMGSKILLGFFLAFISGNDDSFDVARGITNDAIQPGGELFRAAEKLVAAVRLEIETIRSRIDLKRGLRDAVSESAKDAPELDGLTIRFSFGSSPTERINGASRAGISIYNETGRPLNDVFLFVRVQPDIEAIRALREKRIVQFLAGYGIGQLIGIKEGKQFWEMRVEIASGSYTVMELGEFRAVHVPRLHPGQRLAVDTGVVENVQETVAAYDTELFCAEGRHRFQPFTAQDMREQVGIVQRRQAAKR